MSGVVLETLSFKKLMIFASILALFQIAVFLVGGLIAPAPSTSESILATICVDVDNPNPQRALNSNKWFYHLPLHSNQSCKHQWKTASDLRKAEARYDPAQLVFMLQFPLPKSGMTLDMTRWFQQVLGVLMLDFEYKKDMKVGNEITIDVRLGYRNRGDADHDWKELARSMETRPLNCVIERTSEDGSVECALLPLFTLGSCNYDYYLVNIRIPVDEKRNMNADLGLIQDIWIVEIHQNGGFTKVWFALKTVTFPIILVAIVFFWRRIQMLPRPPNLLERTILAVGIVISILNCPVEWLSLKLNVSFWLILSDIRQGLFYATLLCFWIVFTGEHMMDDASHTRNKVTVYWKHLLVVGFGSTFLFIFEISERGVQLMNPFYSVWSHPVPAKMSMVLIVLAGIAACLYFFFLTYMIVQVLRGIWSKRRILPGLPEARRRYYSGVIYRFCALLAYTLLCCALTVIFFIVSQVNEDSWKWGEHALEYSSAFITGVFGMWNAYVFTLLCLYAPSHKQMSSELTGGADPLLSSGDGGTRVTGASVVGGVSLAGASCADGEAIELRGRASVSPSEPGPAEEVCVAATVASGDGLLAFLTKTAAD